MPRPAQPPRLYLRKRSGREPRYVILDGGEERSTGFGPEHKREAEKAFADYLASKHRPKFASGSPELVAVADVLTYYMEGSAPTHASPPLVGHHTARLLEFFGTMTCGDINPGCCHAYIGARVEGLAGRKPVSVATARRELDTLGAALSYAHTNGKLIRLVLVDKPDPSAPNPRWLTRSEAARLLAGALGFTPLELDSRGSGLRWRRVALPNYHVARFILIALYTGTRHASVLNLRWSRSATAGWVDLHAGVLHRRGYAERETRKRRPSAPIPENLAPHLRRWSRLTEQGPCEYEGKITLRQKTGFASARRLARLGAEVTPHTLKHTCITWMLQSGVSTWETAGFTGTSEALIRRVYGHHCRNHMPNAISAFTGRKRRKGGG